MGHLGLHDGVPGDYPGAWMSAPLGAGARVGDYVIEGELGRGGMGVVYRARQERLGRMVALKVIAPNMAGDAIFRSRFDRESRLAAAIEHPNAVPVYEAGESEGVVFIAMRLIDGTDLRALLTEEEWLEPARAAGLTDQVAAALDSAHALGLVHRDVKPANVLIGRAGGREWAFLTDFGLTKRTTQATELTESGKWMGTADYASPEQIQGGKVDARSDVYSLGCVLYEMLTGRIPFERDEPVAKLYAHVHDPPPKVSDSLPEPSPAMDDVIARAMAKDPAERFPSAGDLGRAALAAAGGDRATVPERSVAIGEAAGTTPPTGEATRRLDVAGGGRLSRGGRPSWLLPALGVVGAGAAILLVSTLLLAGGGGEDGGSDADRTTEVGARPLSISVGNGFAWVTNEDDGTVSRIETGTGAVAGEPIQVGENPSNIRFGQGSVWVANAGSDTVSRIDPLSFRTVQTIEVGNRPTGVRVGAGSVWVANTNDGTVSRIEPEDGTVIGTTRVGNRPAGIAVDRDLVWVVNSKDNTVSRISSSSGETVGPPVPVGTQPRGIVADFGSIWVTNSLEDTVSRVSTTTTEEQATIGVGDRPAQLMHEAGFIWVANEGSDSVSQIDPDTNEVVAEHAVGAEPRGVAAGDGLVWVANWGEDTVSQLEP
jgi:serine/threonine-protein kinase